MQESFTPFQDPFDFFRRILVKVMSDNTVIRCLIFILVIFSISQVAHGQVVLLKDYQNYVSAPIGAFQNINFREGGFSGLCAIPNTNGKEFWTLSDRGVNIDAANANPDACHPTYDKIYSFPSYAPKIHRIRIHGDSVQILQSISIKRPGGATATGIINPTGYGSTAAEIASTDTVMNCANFNLKITTKDIWGIDSEGIVVDKDGNFWVCEEGGPTIWKINPNGVVIKRFTPYANLPGAQPEDVQIDSVFKYRKNNRGFEGISITPNGKIFAIIQSPVLFPTKSVGEGTRIHRILEIDPTNNATRMFAYLNDGIIGSSGSNQIRLRDWKIGDMAAINDHSFLVLEAALRGTSDIKRIYKIDINAATPVTSGLYSGKTLEALVDGAGLTTNGITPVSKVLFMDLLANGWPAVLDKAEGLSILNDSTIAISNDNDYGQFSALENGIATATTNTSHVFLYRLRGSNKLTDFVPTSPVLSQGITGISTSHTPYLLPSIPGANVTSLLTVGDVVNDYKMVGIPDGTGAYDNGNGTFTLLMNHELGSAAGVVRAHGSPGSFVSKWIINKSDLSVVSGGDLVKKTYLWDADANSFVQGTAIFNRLCSGDLPSVSAFYNEKNGLGTRNRIYMNGEEAGSEGRAFAHIVTGPEAGTSYQLPYLGRFSWENSVANPFAGNKTIVAGTDDATPGQVYIYIGTKKHVGSPVDKAGLNNGKLYGVAIDGLTSEINGNTPAPGTPFQLVNLGNVKNMTGADLNTASNNAGVTNFLRPEDGQWDPANPNDFYFVTTNGFTSPSRLWRLRFVDITKPELGGIVEVLLDGTEGPKMMDNLTIDGHGRVFIQEDVGNQAHIGKVWQYSIGTDDLIEVAHHDPSRFLSGAPGFLTQDEESSGIIDMEKILGPGKFLLNVQAHYPIAGEVVEGGQLLVFENSNKQCVLEAGAIVGDPNACAYTLPFGELAFYSISASNGSGYKWTVPNKAVILSGQGTNTIGVKFLPGFVQGSIVVKILNSCGGSSHERRLDILNSKPEMPGAITGPSAVCEYIENQTAVTYTIEPIDGAVGYLWTVPYHAKIISGQGTDSLTVLFKGKFFSSHVRVSAIAACGASPFQNLLVTGSCGPTDCKQETESHIYPIPTRGPLTINFFSEYEENYKMYVKDMITGRVVLQSSGSLAEGENSVTPDLSFLKNGYYFLQLISDSVKITERIEVKN